MNLERVVQDDAMRLIVLLSPACPRDPHDPICDEAGNVVQHMEVRSMAA
jgi:hypothetical protein